MRALTLVATSTNLDSVRTQITPFDATFTVLYSSAN